MYRQTDLLIPSLTQEFLEHKAIVEAIEAQDSAQAERCVLIHIHNLGNELVSFLEIPLELMKKKVLQINPAAY
jgi:DNA-binding GntR family transcriptional regulator